MSAELVASHVDARIARVAARQYGLVSRAQLRALGLAESTIGSRIAAGRLHRVHRGVCAVGHPVLAPRARWMAAVLTCGPDAALSHASAAALWEIRQVTTRHAIPVTTPARTSLDLAAVLRRDDLERLLDQAEIEQVTDYPALRPWSEPTRATRAAPGSTAPSTTTKPAPPSPRATSSASS